jgi:crotonobetainyl-CoA:carnitine CoA-transferase CaiB-like acyl-CoA transferase
VAAILPGWTAVVAGDGPAGRAAGRLLRALGARVAVEASPRARPGRAPRGETLAVDTPARGEPDAWAASGAMALTGWADGPPLGAPGAVASCADGAAAVLCALARSAGHPLRLDGGALLGERAALAGLHRRGRGSAGGSARLVRAADGWCAVQLPRADDRDLVPAWFERDLPTGRAEVWGALEEAARTRPRDDVVDRGRLLGLACAPVAEPGGGFDAQARSRGQRFPWSPWRASGVVAHPAPARGPSGWARPPIVADLSALWAGPLCAHLLGLAGARVIKVEDPGRPDGARRGPPAFFDLLHGGHEAFAVDLRSDAGRARLRALLARVDAVVESSRPRALAALGLSPLRVRRAHPHLVWVSITGYGYTGPGCNWTAFGDDAAAAAGLVAGGADDPVFCGDAIADPLTGLCAATAALAALVAGRGAHLDLALRDVAGFALGDERDLAASADGVAPAPVAPPRARAASQRAPALGEHTEALQAELGLP